jgi:Fur family peroxide stress response transcriptional regulator
MRASATDELIDEFRARCAERGLAVTHQRVVIYQALMAKGHHPSPEEIYRRVRRQIPSISLATVYKNIRTFIDHGLLREASPHHGCARLEVNLEPHHHLVCLRCKAIVDLAEEAVEPVRLRSRPPAGFRVERCSVEVQGICDKCSRLT